MQKATVREETVIIPTYEISEYDRNPMFLEKRVYQGSSGRVYPHPVCEGVADVKTDKEYKAIFLENEYILVMILPEIGGKIQRLYDKTNGYDAVYYNEVIKPALVGLAGPWISGGIEFNWPQHHRPSTYDPVDYTIEENGDGSVTVWVGETEKMFHIRGMAGFTVYPDKAYLEIKGKTYNPTDRPQTFLWWANPAVPVNDNTQSIFPPDVHAVMDHGKRDVSTFPIATGTYYKMDYSAGVDISRYKNIPVPTSYMAYHSDFDFIGNYDYEKRAGLLHVADHHVSPGKKQWTWGCGDFGKAWDRNLTDENGPYIELMTGMFTDNQPDFTFLKPYEEKSFVQYFMPYKKAGALKNATTECAVNLETDGKRVSCLAYAPCVQENVTLVLTNKGEVVFEETADISPVDVFEKTVDVDYDKETDLCFAIIKNGERLIDYAPVGENTEPVPSPAEAAKLPEEIETNEELFLTAVHLEQYRHATYSPEPYYLEGLKRDPSDIRINNGYGKYLYNKGRFAESEKYFRAAIKRSTWKNPNPYDCEPYYNLGLALRAQCPAGDKAFDAFCKAAWDGNMQDKAYYQMACICAMRSGYEQAAEYIEKSLVKGLHNVKARTIKAALLRKADKTAEAESFNRETLNIDPLDHASKYELYMLGCGSADEMHAVMRGDNHNYVELALSYIAAGMYDDAARILGMAPNSDEPMAHYYMYFCTGDKSELEKAEKASPLYCFPNRLEDIAVLEKAVKNGGEYAKYYLGNLFYDKGRWEQSVSMWESCADKISLPTVYRNLSLAYYNKLSDSDRAKAAMEKAFNMDKTDARVFFELDQLYKILNYSCAERLANMESNAPLLEKRDDLYTEYITLLNIDGQYEKAYNCIMNHIFHPWEGGEGKITAQYRISLMNLGGAERLENALIYPHNLGEGKLAGATDNDIYYMLGCEYMEENSDKAKEMFRLALRGGSDLSSAMYYNDRPPEMVYYMALAHKALGDADKAQKLFDALIAYCGEHYDDDIKIDYFAVSLPDFLIFDADLNRKNKVHCCFMSALGYMGRGDTAKAREFAEKGLSMEKCHIGLNELIKKM